MRTTPFLPTFLTSRIQCSQRRPDAESYRDAFGLVAPVPAHHGQRRAPDEGFFTGPAVGEHLPDFALRAASGQLLDFHLDRGNAKAAVVFFRSAVW